MLAAANRFDQSRLAALLRRRALAQFGLRMVLAIGLFVGLGAVPLWPMANAQPMRLGLGAGYRLGTVVGRLANVRRLLRLGAGAATRGV